MSSGDRPIKHWPRRNWVAVGSINGEPYGPPEYCWSRRGAERYAALIQQQVRTTRADTNRWAMTVLSRSEWDDTIATRTPSLRAGRSLLLEDPELPVVSNQASAHIQEQDRNKSAEEADEETLAE